jgi:CheY-like chemotaxis protein
MLPGHTGQLVIPTESIRYWTRMIDRTEHTSFSAYTKTISRLESGPPKHGTHSFRITRPPVWSGFRKQCNVELAPCASIRMPNLPRAIKACVSRLLPGRKAHPSRISVVAQVADEHDRVVLRGLSVDEPFDVHFAQSWEEARALATRLIAPVILFDRDWPGVDWKPVVNNLAASPSGTCVILLSAVSDDYLWQEVIRRGGYDVLTKPLKAQNVARVVKLAWSYWSSAPRVTVLRSAAPSRRS